MDAVSADMAAILDRRKLGAFQKFIIVLCTAIVFVEGVNAQSPGYVAPALRAAWGLTPAELGLFFSSGLTGLMFGGLFIAPLADRLGRRPILIGCVALFGICSLGCAAATSIAMLDGLRFLTGLGIGGAMPNAIALTAEYSPLRRRSAMVAVMVTGFILGSIFAGLVAAPLVPVWGWQSAFVIGGVMPLLLLPVLFYRLPESIRFLVLHNGARGEIAELVRRIDPTVEIGANTRLIVEEHAGSGQGVLALFREGRARATVLLWIVFFMSLLNLYLFTSWLTIHVHEAGISEETAIRVGTMFQVGGIAGIVFGWMADKIGPGRVIFTAYLVGAVAIACIGFAAADLGLLTAAVFAAGFGIIGGQTAANALSAMSYPTQIRSTGVGWATGIGRAGSIVGPGLAGILVQFGMSTQNIFYLAVIPALVASLAGACLNGLRSNATPKERAAV